MPRLIEFTTPEGPEFIGLHAINRVQPAPEVLCDPGTPGSLIHLRGRCGPILVRGEARAIAERIEAMRDEPESFFRKAAFAPDRPFGPVEAAAEPAPRPTLYQQAQERMRQAQAEVTRAAAGEARAKQAAHAARAEQ